MTVYVKIIYLKTYYSGLPKVIAELDYITWTQKVSQCLKNLTIVLDIMSPPPPGVSIMSHYRRQ